MTMTTTTTMMIIVGREHSLKCVPLRLCDPLLHHNFTRVYNELDFHSTKLHDKEKAQRNDTVDKVFQHPTGCSFFSLSQLPLFVKLFAFVLLLTHYYNMALLFNGIIAFIDDLSYLRALWAQTILNQSHIYSSTSQYLMDALLLFLYPKAFKRYSRTFNDI